MSARSVTDKALLAVLKKNTGKRYNVDETYVDYLIGEGPAKRPPMPLPRHEAGVVEKLLEINGYPARMHQASRGGDKFFVYVPKIVPAR